MTAMKGCDVGIVLVGESPHSWGSIVPSLLVYDNRGAHEPAVRRLIDRQLAFMRLRDIAGFRFTPVAIILDGVSLDDMDLTKIGVPSRAELSDLLRDLSIKVFEVRADSMRGEKLFPLAWDLYSAREGASQVRTLSALSRSL